MQVYVCYTCVHIRLHNVQINKDDKEEYSFFLNQKKAKGLILSPFKPEYSETFSYK